MAPILPPPPSIASIIAESTSNEHDSATNTRSAEIARKKKQLKQKESSYTANDTKIKRSVTEGVKEDATSESLSQLIQQVLKVTELEEERLKKEEAILLETRINKPPAMTPQNLSPLDSSVPPLLPLKDFVIVSSEPAEAAAAAEEPVIVEEEKPLPEIVPERLSLEEDYPNRTVNPEEIITKEYRERQLMQRSNQWYFDEYSGLYRQNASANNLHQSLPSLYNASINNSSKIISRTNSTRASTTDHHIKNMAENLLRSNSSIFYNNRPLSFALSLRFSKLFEDHDNQAITTVETTQEEKKSEEGEGEDWPTPTSIEQVRELKKKALSMRDRRKQLDLCRLLMDTACKGESDTTFVNASSIPGTPPVHTRYRQQELRKKKKKDLMLDEVLVLEAQKILKKLAIGGGTTNDSGDAQFLLANCYGVGGLGLPLDRERAFALYIHASKQNHAESIYRAGVCYEIGIGTRKDYSRAMIFYRKAATLSHVASMYKLAIILLRGYCGQVKNTREAITWLQRAAALATIQNPHALYALAIFQLCQEQEQEEQEDETNMIPDPAYTLELLHESATQLEYVPSQVKLGELYETGNTVEVDDALSIYWYTRAAEQGNADAALALSSWYLTGSSDILAQSDREAYLWARKAASCQCANRWTTAKAYFLVGMYVDRGIGIVNHNEAVDHEEDAKIWFKRSAALGHKGALKMLDKCSSNNNIPKMLMNETAQQQQQDIVVVA